MKQSYINPQTRIADLEVNTNLLAESDPKVMNQVSTGTTQFARERGSRHSAGDIFGEE